jgi:hypothetical protein
MPYPTGHRQARGCALKTVVTDLAHAQLARANVGVKAILAASVPRDGAEESVLGISENLCIDFADTHRHIDVAVVFGFVDRDVELAGMKFKILVADDVLDVDFPGEDARGEVGILRDMDNDFQFVSRSTGQAELGEAIADGEAPLHILDLVRVFAGEVDGDFLVVGTDDENFTGAQVQLEREIGGTAKLHVGFPHEDGFGFGVAEHWKHEEYQGKTQSKAFHRTPPQLTIDTPGSVEMFRNVGSSTSKNGLIAAWRASASS